MEFPQYIQGKNINFVLQSIKNSRKLYINLIVPYNPTKMDE